MNVEKALSEHPIELVRWVDSASINGGLWVGRNAIAPDVMTEKGLTSVTIGFVIDESSDVLLLVQSIGDDCFGAALAIPKAAIIRRGRLSPERTRQLAASKRLS